IAQPTEPASMRMLVSNKNVAFCIKSPLSREILPQALLKFSFLTNGSWDPWSVSQSILHPYPVASSIPKHLRNLVTRCSSWDEICSFSIPVHLAVLALAKYQVLNTKYRSSG